MSYFGNQLAVILESRGISQTALCLQTGGEVVSSQVSRYLSGDGAPSLETVEKICSALPEADRAEIARAWLYDQMPSAAKNLLVIHSLQTNPSIVQEEPSTGFAMPNDLRAAFDFLERAALDNKDVRASILAAYRILSA